MQQLANQHSQEMATATTLSHLGFRDRAAELRKAIGVGRVAENVAYRHKAAQALVAAWLASPKHREHIEGAFDLTGLGAVQDAKRDWIYTQIFAEKAAAAPK